MTIYDLVYEDDQSELYNVLLNPANTVDAMHFTDSEGKWYLKKKILYLYRRYGNVHGK
jgi:hypothetical protein